MEEHFDALKVKLSQAAAIALEAEQFDRVQELMEAARALKELRDQVSALLATEPKPAREQEVETPADRPVSTKAEAPKSVYPRFFKVDGTLIKRALRGDGATTYDQRMLRANFDQVLAALRAILAEKDSFHAPEVIGAAEVPGYHVYMTLNVLQNEEYLELVKRGQYRFLKTGESPWAETVWDRLDKENEE